MHVLGVCVLAHMFCRVRDTSIIVAVDEPPEEGLEQPLRLEKLANEVGGQTQIASCNAASVGVSFHSEPL